MLNSDETFFMKPSFWPFDFFLLVMMLSALAVCSIKSNKIHSFTMHNVECYQNVWSSHPTLTGAMRYVSVYAEVTLWFLSPHHFSTHSVKLSTRYIFLVSNFFFSLILKPLIHSQSRVGRRCGASETMRQFSSMLCSDRRWSLGLNRLFFSELFVFMCRCYRSTPSSIAQLYSNFFPAAYLIVWCTNCLGK